MTNSTQTSLPQLLSWIQENTGLHITEVNLPPILLTLKVLATESGMSEEHYIQRILQQQIQPQPFIDAITTHESFFLRHQRSMQAAIRRVIVPLLKRGIRPRVLSAPCAQGEEPYSFAMLLKEAGIHPNRVEITAVDIAASSIEQAHKGVYRQYALRQVPEYFIQSHFSNQGTTYSVTPDIKRSVTFRRLNLLNQALSELVPGYHLIFSHNMMIYFDQETNQKMVHIFQRLLDDDGLLLVDAVEISTVSSMMQAVDLQGIRAFQKGKTRPSTAGQHTSPGHARTKQSRPQSAANALQAEIPSLPKEKGSEWKRRNAEDAYRNKEFEKAIQLYEQLIDDHPLWACWARVGKARVLVDSGEEMEALEEAEKALSGKQMSAGLYLTNSDLADAHAIIALVLRKRGMAVGMQEHLEQVRRLNPAHSILKIT